MKEKRGHTTKYTTKYRVRGQVTIFVIVAIVITAAALLIFLFYPKIKTTLGFGSQNPSEFLQNCLEDDLKEIVEIISLQGGSVEPEHYVVYNGEKIKYLCYTGENYKTCVMQEPLLEKSISKEIAKSIQSRANECLKDLKKSYEKRGYKVSIKNNAKIEAELLPKRVVINLNQGVVLEKGDKEKYQNLHVVLNENLYELVSIASSILNWEARYGDSETTIYMNYYHDLKVEKKKLSDGTTVYILTDRNKGNKFQFASRSLAWPPGIEQNIY